MRFFTGIGLLFYVATITILSTAAILLVTHTFPLEEIDKYLAVAYSDNHIRAIVGGVAAALIFLSFIFARIISGGRQKERTIAFDNPAGRVSVSLGAVEDLVRRVIYKIPEIKEVKSHIIATKKGIEVDIRLILKTDVNIPDMTSKLQDLVRSRIQETLGVEETVIVRIHVAKIVTEDIKSKRSKAESEEKNSDAAVPFHGYRI
ncbi:MAG TPA: alkaline shock response membrane anchor protein AmaP [Candidatus Omnitrophota bacterium]|nr:alkaline shock response membrane anchor protein AmaP [Candidatus Omnitrophota bacterium]HPD83913.1 alkaline shock response membrane anchor protein AmaP [Candidatus Omnitrophota bacterium]HRZ02770.1 alkaline shock response membrane anchor protein AmaP [Candidatus Omnitrophota bacterium]